MSSESGTTDKGDQPVTISAPPADPITIDPQNPLPEPNFFYRRIIALVVTGAALGLTWHNLEALHDLRDADKLLELGKWTIGFAALVLTYYFIAPSASELTNMIQSAKIIRSGIEMAEKTAAQNRQDGGFSDRGSDFQTSTAADSRFPDYTLRGPESSDFEPDAAPRGRS